MGSKYVFYISVFILIQPIIFASEDEEDDKIILSPVELIDLVIQNRIKSNVSSVTIPRKNTTHYVLDAEKRPAQPYEDTEMLRLRKIWSRWSKWSHCPVTCGEGTITRQRYCVAGRCSQGEFEEQRRPCHRTACVPFSNTGIDELHDSE